MSGFRLSHHWCQVLTFTPLVSGFRPSHHWCQVLNYHTSGVRFQLSHHWCQISTFTPLVSRLRHITGVWSQTITPLVSGFTLSHHWCHVSDCHTTGVKFQTITPLVQFAIGSESRSSCHPTTHPLQKTKTPPPPQQEEKTLSSVNNTPFVHLYHNHES